MIQAALIARFMGPTWDPPGPARTQVGPMLATWTLLSGCMYILSDMLYHQAVCRFIFFHILQYHFTFTEAVLWFPHVHDDIIKWKHFPRYWSFVQGIHRSPMNSPHKGQWCGVLLYSLNCALNRCLSKHSWGWWFETPLCSLSRHCNAVKQP